MGEKEKTEKVDGRSKSSAENGKKGGRPISISRIRAIAARDYISKELQKNLVPIVSQAILDASGRGGSSTSARERNDARNWLSDRAWGKAVAAIALTDEDGNTNDITAEQKEKINEVLHNILEGDIEGGDQEDS